MEPTCVESSRDITLPVVTRGISVPNAVLSPGSFAGVFHEFFHEFSMSFPGDSRERSENFPGVFREFPGCL